MRVVPEGLIDFINRYSKIIIVGHKEPDGDCVGSSLALSLFLKRLGKKIFLLSAGPFKRTEIMQYDELLDNMLETINSNLSQDVPFSIMLKGTKNIFNYPEFNDIDTVKSFLTLFDNKDELVELVQNQGVKKDNINIIIGDKSMGDLLDNCSIITANFELKGNNIGKFGIIGPKRMDYGKAYSLMKYITKYISEVF